MSLAELQLERLVRGLRASLGANLAGAYLHGSLAMDAFDPAHSDIDVLVVVHRGLTPSMRSALSELLLTVSAAPYPIELSVLTVADASRLRHPVPYELHYSEMHRPAYQQGQPEREQRNDAGDADLVAHVFATRRRGRALAGPPAASLFPMPRRAAVADALLRDLAWARAALAAAGSAGMARYAALNAARALAWAQDDVMLSKREGAEQASRYVDARWLHVIESAAHDHSTDPAELEALLELAVLQLGAVQDAATRPATMSSTTDVRMRLG